MPIDLRTLIAAYYGSKFSWVAAASVMLYDYALTIEHEKSMWQRRWSLGKCLYLFTRYLGVFTVIFDNSVKFSGNLTDEMCRVFVWWEILSTTAAVVSAEVILLCRVYAVYERNNKLLAGLATIMTIGALTSVLVMGLNVPIVFGNRHGLTGCGSGVISQNLGFGMLPPLLNETLLCSLMILKAIKISRDGYGSPLLSKMIYDSVIYFIVMLAVLFIDCSLYLLEMQEWAELAIIWTNTISCAMGSRLLVNIMESTTASKHCDDATITPMAFQGRDGLVIVTMSAHGSLSWQAIQRSETMSV